MNKEPLLHIEDLSIHARANDSELVSHLSLDLNPGECLAIVGESGSGKSLTSLAVMGLLPNGVERVGGRIQLEERDLTQISDKEWLGIRGSRIGMVFQEPMTALNPSIRVGEQVAEGLRLHSGLTKEQANNRVIELFAKVNIPEPESSYKKYPHEMSGGQRQRVVIAMAISCDPILLIADEPTTALDVTVQAEVLDLLHDLQRERGMGMIFITHDLGVVRKVADRVLVLYKGRTVEHGAVEEVLDHPRERYTQGLLASRPPIEGRPYRLATVQNFLEGTAPPTHPQKSLEKSHPNVLLEIRGLHKFFGSKARFFSSTEPFEALRGIDLVIHQGETVGLVGESGCGKSTLGRCIVRLLEPEKGSILYDKKDITHLQGEDLRKLRREIQIIFQDPFSSLNPRVRIGEAIAEPMLIHGIVRNRSEAMERVIQLLDRVGLPAEAARKYPHSFSGGQRQRVGIARALSLQPRLVICDESVSALDVSVQAQVLNLLNDLKEEFGFTYLFISHDLNVVRYMSDDLLVMQRGRILEQGPSDEVYSDPQNPYTKQLIDAIPNV
ncbi:MAG: ABC transporter ATP-binding protein [Bacteroidota bacterium]|nr:ABC transporter ATP-binding protein [Bacteroidota bacterium]